MSYNLYDRLRGVTAGDRLLIGSVVAIDGTRVRIDLPDGSIVTAIGDAIVGDKVYVQGGIIQGMAPDLPVVEIEV